MIDEIVLLPTGRGFADLYQKNAADKVVITQVRQWCVYPYTATGWTDLRVGFFLSLTKATAFDTMDDSMIETIDSGEPGGGFLPARDHYWIGVKTRGDEMPGTPGVIFAGFTNIRLGALGPTVLSKSNNTTGAGTEFWWPHNGGNPNASAIILDGPGSAAFPPPGLQQHFPLNLVAPHGYALLLGLRFTRPSPSSRLWTMEIKNDGVNADMFYSNTPTDEILFAHIRDWPAASQLGPLELGPALPDALYTYWPFHNSRLRIHSVIAYQANP